MKLSTKIGGACALAVAAIGLALAAMPSAPAVAQTRAEQLRWAIENGAHRGLHRDAVRPKRIEGFLG